MGQHLLTARLLPRDAASIVISSRNKGRGNHVQEENGPSWWLEGWSCLWSTEVGERDGNRLLVRWDEAGPLEGDGHGDGCGDRQSGRYLQGEGQGEAGGDERGTDDVNSLFQGKAEQPLPSCPGRVVVAPIS